MARSITVNAGERIEVKNTDGEVMGYFYFNPGDPDLIRRCEEVQAETGKIVDSMKDGLTVEDLAQVNQKLLDQMANILGKGGVDTLFKYNSPLALMDDGSLYAVYVADIVFAFISEEVQARSEKMQQQADKYTAKYQQP